VSDERLSWDDLRYLEALDRLGTVGRVARELGISASTVYRRIAHLEESIGARCIVHGANAGEGRLTETGLALAAVGRRTAGAIAHVSQTVRFAQQDIGGEVSLTTVEGVIPLITPSIAALTERYPDLRVSLHVGERGPSVRRREVDVALSVMPKPPEGLWGRRLFAIQYGVFGTARAYQAAPLRWVVLGPPAHTTPQGAWEKEHASTVVARTGSLATKIALVRQGIGVAVLPARLAALDPLLIELDRYRSSLEHLERSAWILTHPDLREAPRVRVLMDTLIDALA
jgi:molybdate transport repressor ModE-like protein